jgi:hypothetical protein
MAQHENRAKEQAQRREYAEGIAKNGLPPVTLAEVHTALVAWRHSMERAQLAFTARGSTQQPEREIQEAALREVALAKLQFEEKSSVYSDAQTAKEVEASNTLAKTNTKLAQSQTLIAGAVALFTLVQAALAAARAMHWIKS